MEYDHFQKRAIEYISQGHSVLVSAPTGAGKTAIAEYVINDCLARNNRVVYTAPIKALSNQKFRQFQEQFGDRIGILTGDVSINPHASVLIMTTEIFRNRILEKNRSMDSFSWIIFDEIHFLDDYERGSVWEESLIFLPQHMNILALSATIPNIEEIARWIASIHQKPLKVITEERRPVPLHFFYQCQGDIFGDIQTVHKACYRTGQHRSSWGASRFAEKRLTPNRPASLINYVREHNGLPCIYFAFGRRRCERLASELSRFDFLEDAERRSVEELYASLCDRFDLAHDKSAHLHLDLIRHGIAYHHAGMLPTLKEVIERLFTSRLIKVICTTETFALGINMPARTVIFDELRKFYGNSYRCLKTRDFYQMAGRAGRRGLDKEGFVFSRVNPHEVAHQELNRIIYGAHEPVQSQFNTSYATILHLYGSYGENLYDIYPQSLHYFQKGPHEQQRALALLRSKVTLLKELGYIEDGRVSPKGEFAGKIYGYELSLSEIHSRRLLDDLSESELGLLALALVYEPRKGSVFPQLTRTAKRLKPMTDETMKRVHRCERRSGIHPFSKDYSYQLSRCLDEWMAHASFDSLVRHTSADEGEIIRYFRMAIQILREMSNTDVSPALKEKIHKTIRSINRDIIDAERQLRL